MHTKKIPQVVQAGQRGLLSSCCWGNAAVLEELSAFDSLEFSRELNTGQQNSMLHSLRKFDKPFLLPPVKTEEQLLGLPCILNYKPQATFS